MNRCLDRSRASYDGLRHFAEADDPDGRGASFGGLGQHMPYPMRNQFGNERLERSHFQPLGVVQIEFDFEITMEAF